jgi:hypothetical protein
MVTSAEELSSDLMAALGTPNADLRQWFREGFFEDHIKRYSKSRRKAPIYWQLATSSASYALWIYYHRLTKDTFYRALNDFVGPKFQHEERKLAGLAQSAGGSPTAGQRKDIAAQETFVDELRAFREEVARVAPLWNPNLDDGVIINFAPLWRLVPQHRAWQRESKACWDKLCKGEYDWAHLAMHLWPERVVAKCGRDRSLAIAHGLEAFFWYEISEGKWQPRKVDQADVDKLIKERSSAAVKDALKSLLEAPAPTTGRVSRKKSSWADIARDSLAMPLAEAESNSTVARGRTATAPDSDLLSKVKDAIAANGDGASRGDVLEATGITSGQWNTAIRALLADNSVGQTGKRRGARYHLEGGHA